MLDRFTQVNHKGWLWSLVIMETLNGARVDLLPVAPLYNISFNTQMRLL